MVMSSPVMAEDDMKRMWGGGVILAEVFSFRSVSMGLCEALHHTLAQLEGLHRPYRMSQTRRSRLRPAGDRINELGPAAPKHHFCGAKLGKMGGPSGDFRPEQSLDASFTDGGKRRPRLGATNTPLVCNSRQRERVRRASARRKTRAELLRVCRLLQNRDDFQNINLGLPR